MSTPAEMKTEIARMRSGLEILIGADAADRELLQSADRILPSSDPTELRRALRIITGLHTKYSTRSRDRGRAVRVSASRGAFR